MRRDVIHGTLCEVLAIGLARIARTSVTARAFARGGSTLSEHVLVRHLIEHVFRIRLFRPLDARAMRLLSDSHPEMAAAWGRYARSEAVHDRYFLRDLEAIGVERSTVEATAPFRATVELVRFMDGAIHRYGALPVILYSFWAEENSDVGSARIIERTRSLFGPDAARGAGAHRSLDENQDHAGLITDVLAATIGDADALCAAAALLDTITVLIGAYFGELDAWRRHHLPPTWARRRAATRVAAVRL